MDLTMEFQYKICMLCKPICTTLLMYDDNQSVVTDTTVTSSTLKKKGTIVYHCIFEAVAALIVNLYHVVGQDKIMDALTKSAGPPVIVRADQGPIFIELLSD